MVAHSGGYGTRPAARRKGAHRPPVGGVCGGVCGAETLAGQGIWPYVPMP